MRSAHHQQPLAEIEIAHIISKHSEHNGAIEKEWISLKSVSLVKKMAWESQRKRVPFFQIQQQKNPGNIHSSACYTPSHRS